MHNITRFKPLALAAAILVTLGAASSALADETILIGLAGPLTGPSAVSAKIWKTALSWQSPMPTPRNPR